MMEKTNDSNSLWAWVPAALLGSMLCGLGTMAYIAIDDPHFALEPDYYDKAVHWDRAKSEERASVASGIRAELANLEMSADGHVAVTLRLVDAAGVPLRAARVRLEAFPNAYAAHVAHLELREADPGTYVATLDRAVLGLWELRVDAAAGAQRFRETLRREVTRQVKA